MPSIPQSLLWISLVVLWLFVLVPMLISKRDAVRRTSDVALATRVLNRSRSARLLRRRGGPAAGHRSDPDWQPSDEDLDDDLDDDAEHESAERSVVVAEAGVDDMIAEPDYLDVDVVDEDSGALPIGASASEEVEEPDPVEEDQADELTLEFEAHADDDRSRRHRRGVRVRRRFVRPGGALGDRAATGRLTERRAQAQA